MMTCDLCGCKCHETELENLRDYYATFSIKRICPTCAKWANATLREEQTAVAERVKAKLAERAVERRLKRTWRNFWLLWRVG